MNFALDSVANGLLMFSDSFNGIPKPVSEVETIIDLPANMTSRITYFAENLQCKIIDKYAEISIAKYINLKIGFEVMEKREIALPDEGYGGLARAGDYKQDVHKK